MYDTSGVICDDNQCIADLLMLVCRHRISVVQFARRDGRCLAIMNVSGETATCITGWTAVQGFLTVQNGNSNSQNALQPGLGACAAISYQ